MARQAALIDFHSGPAAVDWERMAARARSMHRARAVALYAFLMAVSLPIILPYFWLVTIAFSAITGVAETMVLWRSMLVLIPAVIAFWLAAMLARNRLRMWLGMAAIALAAAGAFTLLVGPTCTCAISSSWWSRISHRLCAPESELCAAQCSSPMSGMPSAIRC